MLIPLGTDRPLKRPTVTTIGLMVATALAYVAQSILGGPSVSPETAERIAELTVLDPVRPLWWTFVTYQFLHGGLLHLGGNMLFLWVFGPPVEDKVGRWWFPLFYLVGGAFAGGVHALVSEHPVIGASGAISAVTGAFMVLFPRVSVRVLLFFFLIGVFHIPALWFILMAIAWDVFLPRSDVAVAAHFGGYAFGASTMLALLALKWIGREPYDLFSMGRQAHRRRVFREATARRGSAYRHDRAAPGTKKGADEARTAAIAERRAEVVQAANAGDAALAGAAYRRLLAETSDGALGRPAQLSLANLLYSSGDAVGAASAYEHFLERYRSDGEAPRVRLMLGLIHARTLNDPVRAKALIREAAPLLRTDDERRLADELLEELG